MTHRILNYRTQRDATIAMKRLLKRYPVHPDCSVYVIESPSWLYPFRWLIAVHGRDYQKPAYWSARR